ncbi:MAG TPA: PASTA domain-containing protein [Cytophagales bacterium]|nr:PASTA domain-containing protein [Cytophagales bacterium]
MKKVLLHIVIVVALFTLLIFFFFNFYLPWSTNHDQKIKVPELKSLKINKAQSLIEEMNLRLEISDSVFNPDVPAFTVISQYPKSGNMVKENRKIYITLSTDKPPLIKMPKLVDASLLNAQMVLQSYGLKLGDVKKVPHFADHVVLKQLYKGVEVKEGSNIGKGSVIDLVVGDGQSNEQVDLPNLIGKTKDEAIELLQSSDLGVGSFNYDPASSKPTGTIVKQKPQFEEGEKINKGQTIDIWISGQPDTYSEPDESIK